MRLRDLSKTAFEILRFYQNFRRPKFFEVPFDTPHTKTVRENGSFGRSENNGLHHEHNTITMVMSILLSLLICS